MLLLSGVSTFLVTGSGDVLIQRLVSTYSENNSGGLDTSYRDLNILLTLSYIRYDLRNYILAKYPRHKLAKDGIRVGADAFVITPKIAKSEIIARFKSWEDRALVEGLEQFKQELRVEINSGDPNRLDFLLPIDLINQFIIGAARISFVP